MRENEVSGEIVDAAVKVHRRFGPGLFESVYEAVLAKELACRSLRVERQVGVPLVWEGADCGIAFRADLVVEGLVIVEIKAVDGMHPVFRRQVLTYLRLSGKKLGLVLNFNADVMKNGIARVVNGL